MGPILDFAVLALTVAVVASLALLAWTIGVGATRVVEEQRQRVSVARSRVAELRRRVDRLDVRGPAR